MLKSRLILLLIISPILFGCTESRESTASQEAPPPGIPLELDSLLDPSIWEKFSYIHCIGKDFHPNHENEPVNISLAINKKSPSDIRFLTSNTYSSLCATNANKCDITVNDEYIFIDTIDSSFNGNFSMISMIIYRITGEFKAVRQHKFKSGEYTDYNASGMCKASTTPRPQAEI